jgi:hypothetical protein
VCALEKVANARTGCARAERPERATDRGS